MRPGHYTVRLTFNNGGYLRFTYKSDKEFDHRSFISGEGLYNRGESAFNDGIISLDLGPRGVSYDPDSVVAVDVYPAKSDPSRSKASSTSEIPVPRPYPSVLTSY